MDKQASLKNLLDTAKSQGNNYKVKEIFIHNIA